MSDRQARAMKSHLLAAALFILVGTAYWTVVSVLGGTPEPWDAPGYWTVAYPGVLLLSAVAGLVRPAGAWAWGTLLVLAQVVVVVIATGVGPLLAAGLLYAVVLSLPALSISSIAGWWRKRRTTRGAA